MTLGDLVLVNALMIQLYMPLNFLGVLYREIRRSRPSTWKMFALLGQHREVADAPDAPRCSRRWRRASRTCTSATTPIGDPARREFRDSGRGARSPWSALGLGQEHAGAVAVPLLRRRRGRIASTARTSARSRRRACARRSASCRRTPCSSTTRWNTTSPTAAPAPGAPRRGGARAAHPTPSSPPARGYDTMVGERGLKLSAARSSAWRSPARC